MLGGHACAKDIVDGKHRRDPAFVQVNGNGRTFGLFLKKLVEPISHGQAQDRFDSPFAGWFAKDGHEIERSPLVMETMQKALAFTSFA